MTTTQPQTGARETAALVVPGLFDSAVDPKTKKLTRTQHESLIYQPSEVQMKTMARIGRAQQSGGAGGWDTVEAADIMLESLFVSAEDRTRYRHAQLAGEVTDEQYTDFLLGILHHFYPQAPEEAPRNGPRPTKRAAARRR